MDESTYPIDRLRAQVLAAATADLPDEDRSYWVDVDERSTPDDTARLLLHLVRLAHQAHRADDPVADVLYRRRARLDTSCENGDLLRVSGELRVAMAQAMPTWTRSARRAYECVQQIIEAEPVTSGAPAPAVDLATRRGAAIDRLATDILTTAAYRRHYAAAWYATHGTTLLAAIAAEVGPLPEGRPAAETEVPRRRLARAVRGLVDADVLTKSAVAARAGITRATLYQWAN